MQDKLITFTIPYYENEILLRKAIDSVISQSVPYWRLIISLDSQLSSEFMCYLNTLGDSRIQVVTNKPENKGICGNWNNCIDLVDTGYVTILHSDDELMPHYVMTMQKLIKESPSYSFYYCAVVIINGYSKSIYSFVDQVKLLIQPRSKEVIIAGDQGLGSLLKGCFIFCPSICYKTEVIKEYKFLKQWIMVLDLDLYARLLVDGHKFLGSKELAYKYRRHDNNQTAKLTKNFERFNEEIRLYNEIAKTALAIGWNRTEGIARKKSIIKFHLFFLFCKSFFSFKFNRAREVFYYLLRLIMK
jgi:glycosyltransferase involved in cell wall biosynthesis